MPNLPRPRLRRTRAGELAPLPPEPQAPKVEEIAAEGLRWVKVDRPGALEQAWLEENFDFHALDYEDVLSRNQRPKIDVYDDYLFIVLQFPIFDPAAGRLNAGELDIFVGAGFLITIPNQPLQPVERLVLAQAAGLDGIDQFAHAGVAPDERSALRLQGRPLLQHRLLVVQGVLNRAERQPGRRVVHHRAQLVMVAPDIGRAGLAVDDERAG